MTNSYIRIICTNEIVNIIIYGRDNFSSILINYSPFNISMFITICFFAMFNSRIS